MKITTSFNPNSRVERQQECLDSWAKYDLPVVAIQYESEKKAEETFKHPNLTYEYTTAFSEKFNCHFPPITSLIKPPCLIINSDIHLTFAKEELKSYITSRQPIVGIRQELGNAKPNLNKYGIDFFYIPEFSPTESEFVIGKPGWDYWLVMELHRRGTFRTLHHGIIHAEHSDRWCREDLDTGRAILAETYQMHPTKVTNIVLKLTGRER